MNTISCAVCGVKVPRRGRNHRFCAVHAKERMLAAERRRQGGVRAPVGGERPRQYRAQMLKKYGITPEEWDAMLAAQGGTCALADGTCSGRLCTDHDHETDAVRGILCSRHNSLLGGFEALRDSAPIYLAAASARARA